MVFADERISSIGALNQRSMLVRISSLPTRSTRTAGMKVMPSSSSTSFARKRANGSPRRRSTMSLTMLRARTNTSAASIVRSAAKSAYKTNSLRKSGEKRDERLAMASSAASTPSSTTMPARISRGLSRNGRRAFCGGAAGRLGVIEVTLAGTLFLRVQQVLQLVRELVDVPEMPIDGREADVGHLVEALELLHHE